VSSAEKGFDPRMITMVAFGGAGPMHAAALAKSVGMPTVLVPEQPGVFSAVGLVMADIRHDYVQTKILRGEEINVENLRAVYDGLEALGREALAADGVPAAKQVLQRTADVRYVGQAYEVNVPLPDGPITAASIKKMADAFHAEHQKLYAHFHPNKPLEFVSGRLTAVGSMSAPPIRRHEPSGAKVEPKGTHPIYFEETGSYVQAPIFDRGVLSPGARLDGPAVVVQLDTTTIVHPGQTVTVDDHANLLIATGGAGHAR
jgi:N-methylhydantoinase A